MKVRGVINRCKFLNLLLTLCGQMNRSCQYMTDPHSCPMYDEESTRPYHVSTSSALRKNIEPETIEEFTNRVEAELNGMGIKVVREEIEDAPDWF